MSVKMQENMLYRTRGWAIVGPFRKAPDGNWWSEDKGDGPRLDTGRLVYGGSDRDLVAEYGPPYPRPIELNAGDFVELRNKSVLGPIIKGSEGETYPYKIRDCFAWMRDGKYISSGEDDPYDVIWAGTASELADRLKAREA